MVENLYLYYPDLFTKNGLIRKTKPYKFVCNCGAKFNISQRIISSEYILKQNKSQCIECNSIVKINASYNVWERAFRGLLKKEDFILNAVEDYGKIERDELEYLMENEFGKEPLNHNPLGFLVYYGYLEVDEFKRDVYDIVEYSLNLDKANELREEAVV